MTVGRYFRVVQAIAIGEKGQKPKTRGRIIWVHPDNRFCVLEFEDGTRECYSPIELGVAV